MTSKFIARGNRKIKQLANATEFYLHQTAIVTVFNDGSVQLNSGGWRTATTKAAMNQVANHQFCPIKFIVTQQDGNWYVEQEGVTLPFNDNMILRSI